MGFKPQETLYKLDFSDTELSGLHVTMRSMSIAKLFDLAEMAERAKDGVLTVAEARQMRRDFAAALVEWDVERDPVEGESGDQPVPATYEGVISQDPVFIGQIIQAWDEAMSQAPRPLRSASAAGASQEASLGLAESSRNLPSSGEPASS